MSRFGYAMVTGVVAPIFAVLFITVALLNPLPRLIWNASASVPVGFYAVRNSDGLKVGELVAVAPPERVAAFLDRGGYLPRNVPLLKHVAALPGQAICRTGTRISIDRQSVGDARERDSRGRLLPVWQGCRMLRDGEIFLMNAAVPDSLDGRYFGPFPASTVLGRAVPLLTRDMPDAPFRWRDVQR